MRGQGPDYASYYRDGGRVLAASEIEPSNNVAVNGKTGERVLNQELTEAEVELRKALARYEDLVARGVDAVSEWDKRDGAEEALWLALSLRHNHVAYFSGRILTLRRMLASLPSQRAMFL